MNANLTALIDRLNPDGLDCVDGQLLHCQATYTIWRLYDCTYSLSLRSYDTQVLFLNLTADGTPYNVDYRPYWWDYSPTTQSHIRKFIDYFGLPIPKYAVEIREAIANGTVNRSK